MAHFTSSIRHAQHAVVVPKSAGDGGVARGPVAADGSEAAALNEAETRVGGETAVAVADLDLAGRAGGGQDARAPGDGTDAELTGWRAANMLDRDG